MEIKSFITFVLVFFTISFATAQDDLLKELDSQKPKEKEIETSAFKGLQICNMQSTKLPVQGEFYVLISHRFGDLTKGLENFFGLDNASTKIGGIYSPTNWLSLGVSRHTHNKIYELAAKTKLANQITDGFPLTIAIYNTADINSELKKDDNPGLEFINRLAFTSQLLISRKFSNAFSAQITPMHIHKNLYDPTFEEKDQYALGVGGRMKLSKRISINLEYAKRFKNPESTITHDPLTLGFDIETGGHVFQMVFANTQNMNDVDIFTNARGQFWDKGSIYFGFNMYRVF
jgi:Membrane bound beta barrel domain (DUF5777)